MSRNDVTGDKIQTKGPSAAFDEGFDRIFGKGAKGILDSCLQNAADTREKIILNVLTKGNENAEPTDTDPSSKR